MKKLYRGPYIDAFCQVWFHLAQLFQRSRLKYEKGNGRTTDTKWGQYLTWPFGSGQLKTIIWPWDQRSRSHKGHYGTRHTTIWSCTHIPIIIDLSRKKKMLWPRQENIIQKTIIWPWGQRSRSHEGHYGTRHTVLWSCTHMPNIIDLSRKTKKLWSVQASLRRSRRKNQTKTICLPSFEGET
jgi:hypothetical protein